METYLTARVELRFLQIWPLNDAGSSHFGSRRNYSANHLLVLLTVRVEYMYMYIHTSRTVSRGT